MGFATYYQAIPVESDLYHLLQEDRAVELLYMGLWHNSKPLDVRETDPEELDELFDDIVERLGFENRDQVDRTFARLEAAAARACEADPDLISRTGFVEKVHSEMKSCLARKFAEAGIEEADELSSRLIFGESTISPGCRHPHDCISLISPGTVKRCSEALSAIDTTSLGPFERFDFTEDLESLIKLYREAGERGEAVIIHGE